MKKIVVFLFIVLTSLIGSKTFAHNHHSNSRPVYLVQKDYSKNEYKFQNCSKHSLIKETTIYFYSNGTRNAYNNYTVINNDGSLLLTDCSKISHSIYDSKHYFIVYKNKKYQLIDENGNFVTIKNYSKMEEIVPNRLLVCFNKNYGIIDFEANTIVPIKYKQITQIDKNLLLTKLGKYYGLIDTENNLILPNEFDKIKILPEVFIIKKENKFGLTNKNGNIILTPEYDSIKNMGEYLIIKKEGKYGALDLCGNKISGIIYKKMKLERNTLIGQLKSGIWVEIKAINPI